jgi:hypothetical protein
MATPTCNECGHQLRPSAVGSRPAWCPWCGADFKPKQKARPAAQVAKATAPATAPAPPPAPIVVEPRPAPAKERAGLPVRNVVAGFFGLMAYMGAYFRHTSKVEGPATSAFDYSLLAIGVVGALIALTWPSRKSPDDNGPTGPTGLRP